MKLLLVVAAALIDSNKRVLIAQRPPGKQLAGLWEFPGGKVDPDERPEDALIRELREELTILTLRENFEPLTFASHAYDNFHLIMPLYVCRKWEGCPQSAEGQNLAWVNARELHCYKMPAADMPLIEPLIKITDQ